MLVRPDRLMIPISSGASVVNPATILGASLTYWGNSQNITLNGSTVSAMANLGGGNNLTQATALDQPTRLTNQLNGFDAVSFDANNKRLSGSLSIVGSSYTAVVMRRTAVGSTFQRAVGVTNGVNLDFDSPNTACLVLLNGTATGLSSYHNNAERLVGYAAAVGTWFTIECFYDSVGGAITHWRNGTNVATNTLALSLNSNTFFLGNGSDISARFDVTELIQASTVTGSQQTQIRDFLRTKYGHY